MGKRVLVSVIGAGILLLGAGQAWAQRFCEHGGKKYSINSTRCEDGKQLRCVAANEWKEIGRCREAAPAKGPQFCEHGGKKYSINSTRCERGKQLRCVAKDEWKEIGRCR